LHANLEQAFSDISRSDQVDPLLIALTDAHGPNPIALWMRDSDIPFGFSSDSQSLRFEIIAARQATILDDMHLQTSGDETSSPIKRFSMITAMAEQVDAPELAALPAHPSGSEIADDVPVSPALQDNKFLGVGNDASIIAVQVLTLYTHEANGGGDLDLYVGFNSQFDEDHEQNYGLPQAGQTFYGGVNWTF